MDHNGQERQRLKHRIHIDAAQRGLKVVVGCLTKGTDDRVEKVRHEKKCKEEPTGPLDLAEQRQRQHPIVLVVYPLFFRFVSLSEVVSTHNS